MHRQSLGSPVSKLHGHGGVAKAADTLIIEDQNRNNKLDPIPSSSFSVQDDDNNKSPKTYRFSFSSPPSEKLVHVIPVLILICFLILYLFSHSPSQSDLAQFHGFKNVPKHLDSVEIQADVGEIMEPKKKGNIIAIQSLRNLKEIEKSHSLKYRSPRKLADF